MIQKRLKKSYTKTPDNIRHTRCADCEQLFLSKRLGSFELIKDYGWKWIYSLWHKRDILICPDCASVHYNINKLKDEVLVLTK